MAKYLRYMGEFLSHAGITWRVEILQEADSAFASIGSLTFEADQPLVIEWKNTSKEDVICGSTATIRIESPGDRTYEDLYTIEVGKIRMDVYRAGRLYWSGALDPEFYEEPYERAANYPVSFTFSDFGILDRLKYDMAGMQTLQAIVTDALRRSTINYGGIDQTLISTKIGTAALTLSGLKVRSDNFYDEDGEASTLEETIEGILQPLGLRMVQRAGKVYIYDLNGLYTAASQKRIEWDGSSSTMGTDKVANNVKITWNTYAQGGNQGPEDCWTEDVDSNLINLNSTNPKTKGNCEYYSFHYSTELYDWIDATDAGFTLWLSQQGQNATLNDTALRFYRIVEQNDGTESEGVAIYWTAYQGWGNKQRWSDTKALSRKMYGRGQGALAGNVSACGGKLFTSSKVWLPPVDDSSKLCLRITLDMLMDCRFNPFEEASNLITGCKQKDWSGNWDNYGNFIYVPVTLLFQPDGSTTKYCWTNKAVVTQSDKVKTLSATYGSWQVYRPNDEENPTVWGDLVYYDGEDRRNKPGAIGWKKNRPGINPHSDTITTILKKAEEGQYVPYPSSSAGGSLWLEVRKGGWMIIDDGKGQATLPTTDTSNPKDLWNKISCILFQLPQFEIMNRQQFDAAINTDDVEYQAYINAAAKEPIEIETICGTRAGGVPTARGAYFNASTGKQVTELTRAGRTTQVEELLIGTIYSQYADRKTTLTGEVELPADGVAVYTEQNQGEKLFMIAADTQYVIQDTSETQFVELRPDEYDKAD